MNASDIRNFVFSKSAVGGYKVSDVKGCLKEISEYVLSLEEKIFNLDRENKILKDKLTEVEKSQDEIKDIMISAQDYKNKMLKDVEGQVSETISQTKEKADKIISEARTQADEIVSGAKENARKMDENARKLYDEKIDIVSAKLEAETTKLEKIKREVSNFKVRLLEMYKAHLDLITKMPEVVEAAATKPQIDNISSFDEERENILGKLQKNKVNNDSNRIVNNSDNVSKMKKNEEIEIELDPSNFKHIKRNMLNNEKIFKMSSDDDDNSKSFLEKLRNESNNYIKSRFTELDK